MSKKISAAILTHNNENTIEKTLSSIEGLIDELVIVDDSSKDRTLEIIKSVFPQAKIYRRKLNNNFSAQRNFSLSKCSSPWVLIIDSDEYLSDDLKGFYSYCSDPIKRGCLYL